MLNKINVLKGFYCCQGARGLSASWGMGSQEPRAITQPAGQGHHQPGPSPTVPKRGEQSSTRHRGQVQSTVSVLRGAGVDEAGPMSIHMSGSRSVESTARHGSGHGCTGDQQFYNISQARAKGSGLELKCSPLGREAGGSCRWGWSGPLMLSEP